MRSLSIFTLLVSSAFTASAAFVDFSCAPINNNAVLNSALVTGGATQVTCFAGGLNAAPGQQITNVTLNFLGTFQDSVSNGLHQLTFSGSSVHGNFGPLNTNAAGSVGFTDTPGVIIIAGPVASLASFVVNVTTSNTNGANVLPDNASYTISGQYTTEAIPTQGGDVPEPSTLALVGGVLVLAGIRKFRS